MKIFSKIINEKTKELDCVACGDKPMAGYSDLPRELGYNGNWYLAGYAPEKPAPTYEEIDKAREEYRKEHIDSKTAMRSRKMANGTWTEKDEQAYLALDAEVTAWIEENLPYPVDNDPEYEAQL